MAKGPGKVSLRTPALFSPGQLKKRVILQVMLQIFGSAFVIYLIGTHATFTLCVGFGVKELTLASSKKKKKKKKISGSKRQRCQFIPESDSPLALIHGW